MGNEAVRIEPVAYRVSMLPEDTLDGDLWQIRVEYTGSGRWAVRAGARCFNRSGEREPEPIPSARTDEWLDEHRFRLEEALELAQRELPRLKFNGLTTLDVLARVTPSPDPFSDSTPLVCSTGPESREACQ